MLQLDTDVTHGAQVFLLILGIGALVLGAVLASRKGSVWVRGLVASGPEGRPARRDRAEGFDGVRVTGAALAGAGLIGIGVAVFLLARG